MSSPERINPFAAPQTQEPSLALPSATQREIPLDPPIDIDGQYTLTELLEASRLMSQVMFNARKRLVLHVVLIVFTVLVLAIMLAKPILVTGLGLLACLLVLGVNFYSGPIIKQRMKTFLAKQEQLGHRARGIITTDGMEFYPPLDAPAIAENLDNKLPWPAFVEARLGESALVLRRPYPPNPRRWFFQILSRSIFRSEADWQRFRDYVARRFDLLPKVIASAPCGRCRREFPLTDLAPPSLLLRWLWPPMLLRAWLTDGRKVSYCRRCRRSVSFALFFIGFMLAVVVSIVLLSAIAPLLPQSKRPIRPRASTEVPREHLAHTLDGALRSR